MNEDKFRELLSDSKLEMPFADFEDKVMQSVYSEEQSRQGILKNIRLSWLFFTIGALFGIIATILLPHISKPVYNISVEYIQIPVLLVLTGVLIWLMDAMLRFSLRNSKK
ncbi:hypothetical protein [Carboxylicivirga caseinilyticus]|uniref:hypothetical protein n=1 Tax=Carboxylicivirga caseinilyticus TaxID=3417572 RepID=UPI003D357ED1|nr:hypothetical protein [Marinilabiliaceae bacterium A049]